MDDLGNYLVAGGTVIAGVVRYHTVRPRPLTTTQRYLLVSLLGSGVGVLCAATTVQAAVATVTEVPYLARFVASASVMVSTFCAVSMVASVVPEPARTLARKRQRWVAAVMVVLIVVMGVLLLGSDAAFNPNLAVVLAADDEVAAGQAVYWGFVGASITWFVILMRHYLSRPDVRPLMHYAMVIATVASVFALLWLGWNVIILVVQRVQGRVMTDSLRTAHLLGIGAGGLMAVGFMLPLGIRALRRRITRWRTRRAVRGLEPLWAELTNLLPEIALHQPDWHRGPEVELYRRVIEIRDAELRLMRYVPPDLETLVRDAYARQDRRNGRRRARPTAVETRIAAAAFGTAMVNFRAGRRQPDGSAESRLPSTGLSDVLAEARWLIAVHRCRVDDPVVADVLHTMERGEDE